MAAGGLQHGCPAPINLGGSSSRGNSTPPSRRRRSPGRPSQLLVRRHARLVHRALFSSQQLAGHVRCRTGNTREAVPDLAFEFHSDLGQLRRRRIDRCVRRGEQRERLRRNSDLAHCPPALSHLLHVLLVNKASRSGAGKAPATESGLHVNDKSPLHRH